MSYTHTDYVWEINAWRKEHGGKIYLNPLTLPKWMRWHGMDGGG